MEKSKTLVSLGLVILAVCGSYRAGLWQRTVPTSAANDEPFLAAKPAEFTIPNPTAVLLGEAPVPTEALSGTITPANDVIAPDLRRP